jgi:hypothetical protein
VRELRHKADKREKVLEPGTYRAYRAYRAALLTEEEVAVDSKSSGAVVA